THQANCRHISSIATINTEYASHRRPDWHQQRREKELRKQQEREQRRHYEEQLRREEERRRAEHEQEYIRRQLEEEQRQLEILQQQLLQEQALLLEYKRKQLEEQRQAERLQRQLQQERDYLVSLQQQQRQEQRPTEKKPLYHYKEGMNATEKPAWAKEVQQRTFNNLPVIPAKQNHSSIPKHMPFLIHKDTILQSNSKAYPNISKLHGKQNFQDQQALDHKEKGMLASTREVALLPVITISMPSPQEDPKKRPILINSETRRGLPDQRNKNSNMKYFHGSRSQGCSPDRMQPLEVKSVSSPHLPVRDKPPLPPYKIKMNFQEHSGDKRRKNQPSHLYPGVISPSRSAPSLNNILKVHDHLDLSASSPACVLRYHKIQNDHKKHHVSMESVFEHHHISAGNHHSQMPSEMRGKNSEQLLVPSLDLSPQISQWNVSRMEPLSSSSRSVSLNVLSCSSNSEGSHGNSSGTAMPVEERSRLNRQSSPAMPHKVANRISDPNLPPRSESFSISGVQPARTPPMLRSVDPQIPHLVSVKSQGPSLPASQSLHEQPTKGMAGFQEALTVTSHRTEMPRQNSDPTSEKPLLPPRVEKFDRSSWLRQEEDIPPKRTSSGSSSSSSTPSSQPSSQAGSQPGSQAGSSERNRARGNAKLEGSPILPHEPAKDLTALAKELRELRIEETNRPLKKVTDYSSSSEESESSEEEEEDGESETQDGTVPVSDIPRLIPTGMPANNESYSLGMVSSHGGLEPPHPDKFSSISREGTLMIRETSGDHKRSGHPASNGFAGHVNLPDLVQQSHSPAGTPTEGLGRVSTHGQEMEPVAEYGMGSSTKASFTPFVDTRVELLRQEQAKLNEARKISVVNVNPTNIRPHSDTPEIRKYKKRFNSEILCAALWGVNLLVGTENGLMLLDRSGQGKVYNLINRRRFQQMDVLEGLNVLVTISGKKNKLRVYYLSWLRNRILHNDPEVEKKQGWITVGDLEGCIHYKVVKYERIKFLVIALKNAVEIYAWAPKPYHKFMAFKSFADLQHKPLLVDLTVEEGQRLKVIFGSHTGFHVIDVDSGNSYDIYIPCHIQGNITPHAIVILPKTDGMEMLVCYEDEGVYVNTYGRITKDVVLQWGEMPTSVAYIHSNQIMGWGEKAIEIRSVETGHLDGVFMHKRAQRLKFLCERNDKVFFASVRSGGSSQVFFMTLNRNSMMNW
ncbi:hypothetical protein E2320_009135, partial [Naja naja]